MGTPELSTIRELDADLARVLEDLPPDAWARPLAVAAKLNPRLAGLLAPAASDPANMTETGNARRLCAMYGADLRYVFETRAWHAWTGTHWEPDTRGAAMLHTADVAEALRAEALAMDARTDEERGRQEKLLHWAHRSLSEGIRRHTLELAACEPGQGATLADFDGNPWLLNVANGTLDLRTRALRPHCRADMLTHCLATPYEPGATCPRWRAFLAEIFEGDAELIDFVHRAAGYSITGDTCEQCLFILHGHGANGKSVFVNTLRHVLGPLARHANVVTFSARRGDTHTEDRARLRGCRLVTVSETGQGQALDESFVKDATGGEPVAARGMRENTAEYVPRFTVWLACNHRPVVRGTDEGIWRRLRLIPFQRYFAPAERDPELGDKLRAEAAGILAWLLDGCAKWQDEGLEPPRAVADATAGYRTESDVLGQFIEEHCETDAACRESTQTLYRAYTAWADENGFRPVTSRSLGLALRERGFEPTRTGRARGWRGIQLAASSQGDTW